MSSIQHAAEGLVQYRRIAVFLLAAFAFTWGIDAIIWQTGGLQHSPEILPGLRLALPLMVLSMFGPAFGMFIARLATGEGFRDHRIRFSAPAAAWLWAWLGPILAAMIGSAGFYLVLPELFDPSFPMLAEQLDASGKGQNDLSPKVLGTVTIIGALTIAPLINALAAFGEELGWRGYLHWKLRPLGFWRAVLITGLIWSIWHWPIITMGHDYGLDYSGYPWLGFTAMTALTVILSILMGVITEWSGSTLPAALCHGTVNATGNIGSLFLAAPVSVFLLPGFTGLPVMLAFAIVALLAWRYNRPDRSTPAGA